MYRVAVVFSILIFSSVAMAAGDNLQELFPGATECTASVVPGEEILGCVKTKVKCRNLLREFEKTEFFMICEENEQYGEKLLKETDA